MWEYTEKVREYFLHPRNIGEIEDPDAVGEVGSLVCGDALKLTLAIDRETNRITDAKFRTFGCASAIASSTALTELIKGKTLDEAIRISNRDIAEYLGGLPREKMHCSVMGREALEAAIANYRGEKPPEEEGGEIVCKCFGVTDRKIMRAIRENSLRTAEDITNFTKAGGGCGECLPDIEKILRSVWAEKPPPEPIQPKKRLTNIQKIAMIQDVMEKEIRPLIRAHGGDVDLIDVEGERVIVSMRALCTGCPMADVTIKDIEKKLRELVSGDLSVESE